MRASLRADLKAALNVVRHPPPRTEGPKVCARAGRLPGPACRVAARDSGGPEPESGVEVLRGVVYLGTYQYRPRAPLAGGSNREAQHLGGDPFATRLRVHEDILDHGCAIRAGPHPDAPDRPGIPTRDEVGSPYETPSEERRRVGF
jgi:hypothetical protein